MNRRTGDGFDLGFYAALLALGIALGMWLDGPVVPTCVEDVVVLGTGNFDNGVWDRYVCGPALDDFVIGGQ